MPTLIVGLDPAIASIPRLFKSNGTVDLYAWGEAVLTACGHKISGVKFQSAYFENYGVHGYQSLAQLIALAQSMGLITIMDAKRGDIGSTSLAYATAYLSPQNDMGDNPFCCDWLTVNPLMGEDCLQPFIDIAKQYKKGIFVLLETSNPGAKMILKSVLNTGETVNQKIVSFIQKVHNELALAPHEFGPVGGVIGATNADASHWRRALPQSVFLMPGIGAQGGHWATVQSALTSEGAGVFVPISRGITTVDNDTHTLADFTSKVQNNLRAILVNQPVEWRTGDA